MAVRFAFASARWDAFLPKRTKVVFVFGFGSPRWRCPTPTLGTDQQECHLPTCATPWRPRLMQVAGHTKVVGQEAGHYIRAVSLAAASPAPVAPKQDFASSLLPPLLSSSPPSAEKSAAEILDKEVRMFMLTSPLHINPIWCVLFLSCARQIYCGSQTRMRVCF
jgi:hypothetical protein